MKEEKQNTLENKNTDTNLSVGVQQQVINDLAEKVGKENIFVLQPNDPLPILELKAMRDKKHKEKNWKPTRY